MDIQIIVPKGADQTNALDHALTTLTEAIHQVAPDLVAHGILGGSFGYGADYENDVFVMRPQYWGDCDCGADERAEKWSAANPHADNCFQIVLRRRLEKYDEESGYDALDEARRAPGTSETHTEEIDFGVATWSSRTKVGEEADERWQAAYDERDKAHTKLTAELYDEYGIPRSPYQWLCTCGVQEKAEAYFEIEGHYATCSLELPNFQHKASGLEVRWYKWIGRDMEAKIPEGADLQAIFSECLASLKSRAPTRGRVT